MIGWLNYNYCSPSIGWCIAACNILDVIWGLLDTRLFGIEILGHRAVSALIP